MGGNHLLLGMLLLLVDIRIITAVPVGKCPATNDELVTYLPHDSCCTLYYHCERGMPILKECLDGLYLNPTLRICDWTEGAGCHKGCEGKKEDNGSSDKVDHNSNVIDERRDKASSNINKETASNNVVGKCPSINNDVHLPHKTDCTLFYHCDWGVEGNAERDNDSSRSSDEGSRSSNENGSSGSADGSSSDEANENSNGESDVTGEENSSSSEENGNGNSSGSNTGSAEGSVDGKCPPINSANAVHLPHKADCTLFYHCDWGVPIQKKCPENTGCDRGVEGNAEGDNDSNQEASNSDDGFGSSDGGGSNSNEYSKGSDEGSRSSNDNGSSGSADDSSSDEANENSNGESDVTGEENSSSSEGNNNSKKENGSGTSSGSNNCTLFYYCDWGVLIQRECPDGLHFNPTLQVCDWLENAGCDRGAQGNAEEDNDGNQEGSNSDVGFGSSDGGQSNSNEDRGSDEGSRSSNEYSSSSSSEDDSNSNEGNGSTCGDEGIESGDGGGSNSNEDSGSSDKGSRTSNEDGSSDSEEDSSSDVGSESSNGENDVTREGSDGSESNGSNSDDSFCDFVSCPLSGEGCATFVANERDCTKFCLCNLGLAYEFVCPDGLSFNSYLNVCDWRNGSTCGETV
ncbi:hypothetical protein Trydic_g2255 [Trypoxylus dichotomus]